VREEVCCGDEVHLSVTQCHELNTSPDFRDTQYSNYVQEDVKET